MAPRRQDFDDVDAVWQRPRALYLLGGGWILFVCWFVGSLAGLDKRVVHDRPFLIRGQDVDVHSQQILLKLPAVEAESFQDFPVDVQPSQEVLPMSRDFYTSNFSGSDTSTTIIFNVFKGRPKALAVQLLKALTQKHVAPPEVWVMCFNSPMEKKYKHVVEAVKRKYPALAHKIKFTVSDFNFKFHGRFLLAYMATTKYVLIVDDDKAIDGDTVNDYLKYMKIQKGVWGNNGHRRAATFEGYKSWPRNFTGESWAEQDYLSGMWFLEQSWLEYFMKERLPSWSTSEDMHLSHVMRKYLNLNTYAGRVAIGKTLPRKSKEVQATQGSALDLREFIFDHELGRGNKVVSVDAPIQTLVYAETVGDIDDYLAKLDACPMKTGSTVEVGGENRSEISGPWCKGGKTAAVFRGAKEQDVNGLIKAAEKLCAKTNCEYFSVKPNIRHAIKYFNMREGYGQSSSEVEIPFQTGASDVMLSLVGILNNVLPDTLFVPDVDSMWWPETDSSKRNRLSIYHRTVLLAVDIHRNSKTNGKVIDGQVKAGGVVAANIAGQAGVNTTAETLVGGADDEEVLLALSLEGLSLSRLKDLVGGGAVAARLVHGALGAGELGRGNDLHGLGDLLDVANRLEAILNLTEGGIAGDSLGGGNTRSRSRSSQSWPCRAGEHDDRVGGE